MGAVQVKLSAPERARVRSQFTASLCTLGHLEVYWLARQTRLLVRSVTSQKRHAVPDDAEYVGTYSHPFGAEAFLGDLDALLTRLHVEESRRATGNGSAAFA